MPEQACKGCGVELVRTKWNSSSDMLACRNINCQEYGRPVSSVVEVTEKKEQQPKIPSWLGGSYGKETKFSEKLRRLQKGIRSKDEEPEVP